jgi:hypothetical protein
VGSIYFGGIVTPFGTTTILSDEIPSRAYTSHAVYFDTHIIKTAAAMPETLLLNLLSWLFLNFLGYLIGIRSWTVTTLPCCPAYISKHRPSHDLTHDLLQHGARILYGVDRKVAVISISSLLTFYQTTRLRAS